MRHHVGRRNQDCDRADGLEEIALLPIKGTMTRYKILVRTSQVAYAEANKDVYFTMSGLDCGGVLSGRYQTSIKTIMMHSGSEIGTDCGRMFDLVKIDFWS